jgi:endonuclease/exonuclease/phosphatase family metal-dependent hydrolase
MRSTTNAAWSSSRSCDLVDKPTYRRLTAVPVDPGPVEIGIERPILHAELDPTPAGGGRLHVVNVHLKSTGRTARSARP